MTGGPASLPNLVAIVDEIQPGIVADRRHLHEHPELGFQEFETAEFVRGRLEALGVEDIRTGLAITGVIGVIRGTAEGPNRHVLLRADMDALPIQEETLVDFRSQHPGIMHACGHDAHTAILLAVARVLSGHRDAFSGTVTLCFQPAEEMPPGGGIQMIEAGVLDGVDAVFALHMAATRPTGEVNVTNGGVMAGGDLFEITVHGQGGHGAMPETTIDPVVVAAHIVTALQAIVARGIDPMDRGVVSVCAFKAGDAFNVIPDTAMIGGTFRYFSFETGEFIERRIGEIARGVAESFGASAEVLIKRGYPPTVNDDAMTDLARAAISGALGDDAVVSLPPSMGGEDFAHFLRNRPGCYFNVGCEVAQDGVTYGHHHPKFMVNEDALATGVVAMAAVALRFLNEQAAG